MRQRENAIPDAAFDDVVDAVAGATNSRPSWVARNSQRIGLILMMAVLIGLPLLIILAQPNVDPEQARVDPWLRFPLGVAVVTTAFLSFAACIGSVALARAAKEIPTATCLAWASAALAGIAGWFAAEPVSETVPMSIRLVLSSALVLIASAAAALAARVSALALFAVALSSAFTLVAASCMIIFPGNNVEVAAITLTVMAFLTSFLPTLSYRIAGIALPNLPVTTEAMLADETPVQSDIVSRALFADRLLGSMLAASSATAVLAALLTLTQGSIWSTLLPVCVGLAFLLRARSFVGLTQRMALLIGGALCVAMAVVTLSIGASRSLLGMSLLFAGCLVLAYVFAHYSASTYNKVLSPTWGRWGDVFEWLAIIGIVPTLLGVLDLYAYFGSLL
ncbi:type VII secretion integral membrane protein EccD [Tessaracoccus coleopterorum]|uniref:type VII secretion integral membrane protein EccD n=1 Tax=Tessaracoccus coleopterorum TaxID=2714950 RepID=UPI001E42F8FA|nr:type VII secretion integral membrane protein EccD [Tessaracoccus coleopterorum]